MLIVKDAIIWAIRCLIVTILAGVCMENGWILSNSNIDVSYAMFWDLYSVIFTLVPLIMFYRGFIGKYHVEIKEEKFESTIGIAKLNNKALFKIVKK